MSTFIVLRCGPIDARWLQREVGKFTEDDIVNLDTGHALVRMGLARDTFNVITPRRAFPENDFRDRIVQLSRQRYCHHVSEVEKLLARRNEEERFWIVDGQGNVFTGDDVKKGRAPSPRPQRTRPSDTPEQPTPETEDSGAQATAREETARVSSEGERVAERIPEDEKRGVVEAEKDALFRRASRKAKVTKEKGESQHRYLQSLIKRIAEEYGFRATIEKPTPDRQGRVDVSLEGRSKRIAFEVSMTTTDEQELSNITKCISAGYDKIVSCSPERRTLNKVMALAEKRLSEADLEKVLFLRPEELPFFLEREAAEESNREETVKGYRVKVQYQPVDEAEKRAKREAVAQVILQALRRLKDKDPTE